jgi:probable rRNA maturation factor
MSLNIQATVKGNSARLGLPFSKIADAVLGSKYELSLTFIGEQKMRALNKAYRNKDYATDILSFPIDTNLGEIYICENIACKKARVREESEHTYLGFLFIHGCLHLKGMTHGSTMETAEKKLRQRFSI